MVRVPAALRQHLVALRILILLTLLLGLAYPLAVTGLAQAVDSGRANGQLVTVDGRLVGSRLLGQTFADAGGNPLPEWFQPRPGGYDGRTSGASNLGPSSPELAELIANRRAAVAQFDSVDGHIIDPAAVPPDAVTASASGLDPAISVAYAQEQTRRVAQVRGLDVEAVQALVAAHVDGRSLGFLGEPTVNVLELNLSLSQLP